MDDSAGRLHTYQTIARLLPNAAVHILDRDFRFLFSDGDEVRRKHPDPAVRIGRSLVEVLGEEPGREIMQRLAPVLEGKRVSYTQELGDRSFAVHAVPLSQTTLSPSGVDRIDAVDSILVLTVNNSDFRRIERELKARNRILDVFLRVPDDQIYREALEALLELTGSKVGLFGYLDHEGTLTIPSMTESVFAQCRMEAPLFWEASQWKTMTSTWARALQERRVVVEEGQSRVPNGHISIDRSVAVPIVHHENLVGLVHLANKPTPYDADDLRLIEILAGELAPILAARLEREQAASELRVSEERFRDVLFGVVDWVWETDEEYNYTYCSDQVRQLLGYEPHEVIGRNLADFMYPDEVRQLREQFDETVRTGEILHDIENTTIAKDGRPVTIQTTMIPRFNAKGRLIGFRGVDRDVTVRRRMETEALKSHKLESLGVLAGGIAHDFNNILTAVMGNVSLARDGLPGGSPVAGRLLEAERALLRAQDLTHQLLTFAKGGAPVRKPTSIANVITESAGFVLSGSGVLPILDMPDDLWPVEIDVGQFSQVVQNLVLNSSQAMPDGGAVVINARNVEEILDRTGELLPLPMRWVEITVSDDGPGIPTAVADRVFEPYFSTKAKGSGLGLSVCHSVVTHHEGRIWFESSPGQGTTFHICLPASNRIPDVPAAPLPKARNGKGRILVMDDEPMILDVSRGALEASGFSVETVPNGAEALRVYREARDSGKAFAAVVLDVTIAGGMGGLETLEQLRAIEPGVRAVVSSGYATAPVFSQYRDMGFQGMLTKPYRPSDLVEAVSRVLQDRDCLATEYGSSPG